MASEQPYEQQIEAGKEIVKDMLRNLALALKQPEINDFYFRVSDRDFDESEISIFDPHQKKTVLKVKGDDLADAPATPTVRRSIETQLREAVKKHYKI